jgi:GR25 family glycosyltransferase involved in LPS biosynthesis
MFDGLLYINLEIRKDRRKEMEEELKKLSLASHMQFRIEAIFDECNGTKACVASHIKALNFALEKNWNNVLVLEDDCMFLTDWPGIESYVQNFRKHFKQDWDVFFLGANPRSMQATDHPDYHRTLFALNSHAYLVNGPYIRKLRDHFITTFEAIKEDLFFVSSLDKALDRKWVDLQLADRWYIGRKPIAKQRDSYSDIEKRMKSHDHYS